MTVIILISAFLLWLDKDADEIIFREKTSYNNEGIEEVNILWLGIGRNFGIDYRFTKNGPIIGYLIAASFCYKSHKPGIQSSVDLKCC